MRLTHHNLDVYPLTDDNKTIYINEPWLADKTYRYFESYDKNPENQDDNIRVFVPIDLNHKAIIRRLNCIIASYGEANEENEMEFCSDVEELVSQIEIYDQIWYVRNMPNGRHSEEAKKLVADFVKTLKKIPDGCSEIFPFDLIDYLNEEYLK